jgi:tetratricopeptide (TPR) repeat protein
MSTRAFLVALALIALGAITQLPSPGQPPPARVPQPPSAEEVAHYVHQLGADDYHERERATTWLWAAGPAAEDALRAGLKSADYEIVARCRDLLDKIPYGITPDMPRRFVELIAAARSGGAGGWPAVAPELVDLGPRGLELAQKLVDRIASNDAQRDAMRRTIDLEGWRVAPALLAIGQVDRAGELLERSAAIAAVTPNNLVGVRHYAAFVAARGKLGEAMPRWRERADKAAGAADKTADLIVLTHLARLHDDLVAARGAAEMSGRADLKEAVLFDQGAWADLADLPAGGRAPVVTIGLKAMYLSAAAQTAEANAAFDELKKIQPTFASAVAPPLVFRALMYAGHPAEALAALDKYKSPDGALPEFEVLCQQLRFAEAFAKLDKPIGEHTAIRWQWDTAKLRIYAQRGERDKIQQTVAALAAYDTLSPAEATPALETVELLAALDRTASALPIAAALLNGGAAPADVFGKLYPKASLAAETWWRYERLQNPSEPMRTTVSKLPALLDNRLAEPSGRAALEAAAKVARGQADADADRWLQGLAEACQSVGLDEQARNFAKEAGERANSWAAWLRLGDLHADVKQFAEAAAAYERSWKADSRQALPLWLHGWALEKAGQPGGPEARQLARMLPLGDEDARYKFAEDLVKRAAFGQALRDTARGERQMILRLSVPQSNIARNAQARLSGDRGMSSDRLELADSTQRFLLRLLRTTAYFFRNQDYLNVLHRLANQRAQGLLAKGDVAAAVRDAETAQALLPAALEPAIVVVPELAKAGHQAEADRVYKVTAEVYDRLCKDYPQSGEFRNNRALLSARCKRDLDAATELARKAVELVPGHVNYRETLAEVLFQRGDKDAALAEIKRCVESQPKDVYYAKQKARMEAGDRGVPVPER